MTTNCLTLNRRISACADGTASGGRCRPRNISRLTTALHRLGAWAVGFSITALVVATILYGERWLLVDAPVSTIEYAMASSVADAFGHN